MTTQNFPSFSHLHIHNRPFPPVRSDDKLGVFHLCGKINRLNADISTSLPYVEKGSTGIPGKA